MENQEKERYLNCTDEYIKSLDSCEVLKKILLIFQNKLKQVLNTADKLKADEIKNRLYLTTVEHKKNDIEKLLEKKKQIYEILIERDKKVHQELSHARLVYPLQQLQMSNFLMNEIGKLNIKVEDPQNKTENLTIKEETLIKKQQTLEALIAENQTIIDEFIREHLEY
ncbi:uncharacterized protein [Euwallacea fornicatus]|uniref:uncharacterized protein n=1 Tax=Euwallacea fornicatus TaxID=995702 RepID=UPI00338DD075